MITSYAQNFEDVMLWRALKRIEGGFYIDVGAQHPVVDSVSKVFYEHGWRGVHVEPTATYANLLREDRPDEPVVQAAVAARPGLLTFYEIPGGGLSTLRPDIAASHYKNIGCQVVETVVTAVTLDELLRMAEGRDVHWLKIDVEGYEEQALSGWVESDSRPWIIVIESTYPNTQTDTFLAWEDLIVKKGYVLAYADGLNRYYLSVQHLDLKDSFRHPPNVFDDFQFSGTATSFTTHLRQRYEAGLADLQANKDALQREKDALQRQLLELNRQLDHSRSEAERQERSFRGLLEQSLTKARQGAESHLAELLKRERAFADRLEEQRCLADRQASEAAAQHATRETESKGRSDAREAELLVELSSLRQALDTRIEAHSQTDRLLAREQAAIAHLTDQKVQLEARDKQLREEMAALRTQADSALADAGRRLESLRTAMEQRLDQTRLDAQRRLEQLLERERTFVEVLEQQRRQSDSLEREREASEAARTSDLKREAEQRETRLANELMLIREQMQTGWATAQRQSEELVERERTFASQIQQLTAATQRGDLQLAELRTELATVQSAKSALESTLELIHRSPAWRLTRPLRWLAGEREVDESSLRSGEPERASLASNEPLPTQADPVQVSKRTSPHRPRNFDGLLRLVGEDFIRAAYQAILGRDPDPEGLRHYLSALRDGRRKTRILYGLARSDEAKARARCQDLLPLPDDAFIDAVYQRLLGRRPDPTGKDHYLRLLAKRGGRQRVIRDIKSSPEARACGAKDLAFTRSLQAALRTEGGLGTWLRSRGPLGRVDRRLHQLEHQLAEVQLHQPPLSLQGPLRAAAIETTPPALAFAPVNHQETRSDSKTSRSIFECLADIPTDEPGRLLDTLADRIRSSQEATALLRPHSHPQ